MTLEQLKAEWDKLPLMRQHIADIEKAMYAALMRGEHVEGLKLVEGRPGNRSWDNEDLVLQETEGNISLLQKTSIMSPTDAEKAHKGTPLWARLESHVVRKPGQPSIATADDKRPAWTPVSDTDLED